MAITATGRLQKELRDVTKVGNTLTELLEENSSVGNTF
jgi:hypothetical protein